MENRITGHIFISYILIALVGVLVAMAHSTEVKIQRKILAAIKDNGCNTSQVEIKENFNQYIDNYKIENL